MNHPGREPAPMRLNHLKKILAGLSSAEEHWELVLFSQVEVLLEDSLLESLDFFVLWMELVVVLEVVSNKEECGFWYLDRIPQS